MGPKTMQARLHSLEEQLRVLKAQAEAARKGAKPDSLSSLYGILKGKSSFDEKAIDEALYRGQAKSH